MHRQWHYDSYFSPIKKGACKKGLVQNLSNITKNESKGCINKCNNLSNRKTYTANSKSEGASKTQCSRRTKVK